MTGTVFTDFLRQAGNSLLDLLYPPALYCVCCGKIIDETRTYRLCNDCMDGVKWATGRTCGKCGKPLSDADPGGICYSCREHPHVFDRGYTCAEYGMHEREIVFAMKYGGRTDIAVTLGEILHDRLEMLRALGEMPEYDLIVPVPMFRKKQRERGFNQTDLMARELAKQERLPYDPGAVIRVRETKAMRGLTPEERKKNIHGAFEVIRPEAVEGKDLLVIDDLYTTGATADAMAGPLKKSGAGKVYFLTFAAGADVVKAP